MSQKINLSNRLKKVALFLPKGANFADIGSDHAYLPCYVCRQDRVAKAIAGEVNVGPFNSAKTTVQAYQLSDKIDVRLGDGLQVIEKGEVKQIVIAGMGGPLIQSILENGKDKLQHVEQIIAQPNVDARGVRKWLMAHNFQLTDEELVEENGHFYEIINATKRHDNSLLNRWTEKELLFGPFLLAKQTSDFYRKWQHEMEKMTRVINQMKQATIRDEKKITEFERELSWIKEVMNDGN
ncbi:tRNA (adenine(22)-N(1))-methyltransferase [Lentibacillus sp. Marseille-P4043]|uniref:tRNA (adenine(22)-N(1))-methyltransferase n=1 Tax=Lentibacillus sp. Marseille-P4043 TaxID=2040293 RepID=UPI000D0BDE0B|nr:class I SAM-dependent methyltransferase [Lentibacillus sp. Marseille-P4043]